MKTHSHPLTEYCLYDDDLTAKPYAFDTGLLDDLGTIVMEPIEKPTNDQFENITESGYTVVNIEGRWFFLTALDDLKDSMSLGNMIGGLGLKKLGQNTGNIALSQATNRH